MLTETTENYSLTIVIMRICNLYKVTFHEISLKFSPPEWYQEPALAHGLHVQLNNCHVNFQK